MQTLLMQSESCVTLQNFSRHDRVTVSRLSISYISLSVVCYLSTSSQILTLAKKRKKKKKRATEYNDCSVLSFSLWSDPTD